MASFIIQGQQVIHVNNHRATTTRQNQAQPLTNPHGIQPSMLPYK